MPPPPLLSLTRRTHTNACATREVERLAPLRGMYGAGARRWMDMEGRRGNQGYAAGAHETDCRREEGEGSDRSGWIGWIGGGADAR